MPEQRSKDLLRAAVLVALDKGAAVLVALKYCQHAYGTSAVVLWYYRLDKCVVNALV